MKEESRNRTARASMAQPRASHRVWVILLLWAAIVLQDAQPAHAGECTCHTMNAKVLIRELGRVDPDSLSAEARCILACFDSEFRRVSRGVQAPPSWRLLRNKRRAYRQLGMEEEFVNALRRLRVSRDSQISADATIALALVGFPISSADISIAVPHFPSRALLFAFIGDSTAVHEAIAQYSATSDANLKIMLLDVLYYHGTEEARLFISHVAGDESDPIVDRARWMKQHPFTRADSWKI